MSLALRSLALYLQPAAGGAVSDSVTLTPSTLALAGNTVTNSAGSSVGLTVGHMELGARSTTAWTPAAYDGSTLVRWFDASQNAVQTDNTAVTEWTDASPNATDIDAVGTPTIQTNELNGLPVIQFDGGTSYFDTLGDVGLGAVPFAVIFVAAAADNTGTEDPWTSRSPTDAAFSNRTASGLYTMATFEPDANEHSVAYGQDDDTAYHIHVMKFSATSFGRLDGTDGNVFTDSTDLSGADLSSGFTIGVDLGLTSAGWAGTIAEMAFLDGDLSVADAERWEGYLAWKYDLVANLPTEHPYKTGAPMTDLVVTLAVPASVAITVGNLALAGGAHTLTDIETVMLTAGSMALAGGAHALAASETVTLTVGDLALAGNALTVNAGSSVTLTVGDLALAGGAHTLAGASNASVDLTVGDLALGGGTHALDQAQNVALTVGDLALAGGDHTLTDIEHVTLTVGNMALAGQTVGVSAGSTVALTAGDLALGGNGATLNEEVPSTEPFVQAII